MRKLHNSTPSRPASSAKPRQRVCVLAEDAELERLFESDAVALRLACEERLRVGELGSRSSSSRSAA